MTLDHLTWSLCAEGQGRRASKLAADGLAIREQALGAEHPGTAQNLEALGWLYLARRRHDAADPLLRRAFATLEATLGRCAPGRRTVQRENAGRSERTVSTGEQPGVAPAMLIRALETHAALLRKARDDVEADKVEARLRSLREAGGRR